MKPDEIIESILQIGIKRTCEKHGLVYDEVHKLFVEFKGEDILMCNCTRSKYVIMCFNCSGREIDKFL